MDTEGFYRQRGQTGVFYLPVCPLCTQDVPHENPAGLRKEERLLEKGLSRAYDQRRPTSLAEGCDDLKQHLRK